MRNIFEYTIISYIKKKTLEKAIDITFTIDTKKFQKIISEEHTTIAKFSSASKALLELLYT